MILGQEIIDTLTMFISKSIDAQNLSDEQLKRGYHTLKSQLVADQNTEEIICVFWVKGSGHDFSLFKKIPVLFHPLTASIEESGYQGIAAYHSNSSAPKKKPKNGKLTELKKEYNKALDKKGLSLNL